MDDDKLFPLPPTGSQNLVFCATGGSRLIIIRAGPGVRADLEHMRGFVHGVSDYPIDTPSTITTHDQAAVIARKLPTYIAAGRCKFLERDGVEFPLHGIQVFHDGNEKSKSTFRSVMRRLTDVELYSQNKEVAFVDSMTAKPSSTTALQWLHDTAFHANERVLQPVVVFASWLTIQRLLAKARRYKVLDHLEGPMAGSACVVDFPACPEDPAMIHAMFDTRMSLRPPGAWANKGGVPEPPCVNAGAGAGAGAQGSNTSPPQRTAGGDDPRHTAAEGVV